MNTLLLDQSWKWNLINITNLIFAKIFQKG